MMRDHQSMRREGARLAAECIVSLQRVEATTNDRLHSITMSVAWLDEVEAKVKRARWLLRQVEIHAKKRARVEADAKRLPTVTDAMWRRLSPTTRSQLLLLVRKEQVVGKPGGSLVLYLLGFNVELAASVAKRLAAAAKPPSRQAPAKAS